MGEGGAEGQTRTVDTGIFSAVLYHLSYLGGLIYLKSAFICCQVRFSRRPPHFNHSRQLARQLTNDVRQPGQVAARPRRRARPGRAPVFSSRSMTTRPLTITYSMPMG